MLDPEAFESATRVVIADQRCMVRQALAAVLATHDDFVVVTQASDAREAVRFCLGHKPDIVLLDRDLPAPADTFAAIPEILDRSPSTRVVLLSDHDDVETALMAIRSGAAGYVLKDADEATFIDALRTVRRGEPYVASRIGAAIAAAPSDGDGDGVEGPLTRQERGIVELVALGFTSREIGDRLGFSMRTVETYRARIGKRLGWSSRADFVRYALVTGLLGTDHESSALGSEPPH